MKRSPLVRRTPLRQVSPKRAGHKTVGRPAATGFDRNTVDAILERAHYQCEIGGEELRGDRGRGWSIHHRRPRQMGGTDRPDVNLPSNGLAICGSGVDGCHGHIESHRTDAYDAGWLIHADGVPSQILVLHSLHGWCFLTDDARIEMAPPPVLRGKILDLGGYWPDGGAA